jgi:hypothetical protein
MSSSRKGLFAVAIVVASAACARPESGSSTKEEIVGGDRAFRQKLGTSYNSLVGVFGTKQCVDGTPVAIHRATAELEAGYKERVKEDAYSLLMTGDAHGAVSGLKVKGHMELETSLGESELSKKHYLTFTYTAGNIVLTEPKLSELGRSLAEVDLESPLERLQTCGNEYLYQVELGGRLHAGVEYIFATHEMKSRFSAWVSAKDPTGTFEASYDLPSVDVAAMELHGMARLVFEQEGGDMQAYGVARAQLPPSCLTGRAFAAVEAGSDSEHMKKVKLSGLEDCIKAYRDTILPYAREGFRKQIATLAYVPGNPLTTPGLDVLRFFTKPYLASGFVKFQQDLLVPAALRDLAARLKTVVTTLRRVTQLLRAYKDLLTLPEADIKVFGLGLKSNPEQEARIRREEILALTQRFDDLRQVAEDELGRCVDRIAQAVVKSESEESATGYCSTKISKFETLLAEFMSSLKDESLKKSLLKGL